MSMRFASVQRRLSLAIKFLFMRYKEQPEVNAIASWIEWQDVAEYDITNTIAANVSIQELESDTEIKSSCCEMLEFEKKGNRGDGNVNGDINNPKPINCKPIYSSLGSVAAAYITPFKDKTKNHALASQYPILCSLNIDVLNRSGGTDEMRARFNMDNIMREIIEFKKSRNEEISYESINSNKKTTLCEVPLAPEEKFYKRAVNNRWLETVAQSCTTDGSIRSGILSMFNYFFRRHRLDIEQALDDNGLLPKVMSEFEVLATMLHGRIGISQWRNIVQCLKTYLGLERVCVPEREFRILGDDHGDIKVGEYAYEHTPGKGKELCKHWCRDPMAELIRKAEMYANSIEQFNPKFVTYMYTVYGGDHGKGKFRFPSKFIVKYKGRELWDTKYQLGEVDCKKDTDEVLRNTIMPDLVAGINSVEECCLKFSFNVEERRWKVQRVEKNTDGSENEDGIIEPIAFLCGDLAFLFTVLGREGYEGWWCYFCKLFKTEWQTGTEIGESWDLDMLKLQLENNKSNKLTGRQCMGVKGSPYFSIPIDRIIWPLLHSLIGIGNQLLNHVVDYGELYVECLSARELQMRQEVIQLEQSVADARQNKKSWESNDKTRLRKLVSEQTTYEVWLETNNENHPDYNMIQDLYEMIALEINFLQDEIDEYNHIIDRDTKKISANKKQLTLFRTERKSASDSLYTGIDAILQKHRIKRQAYHGGDLQGNDIIIMMRECNSIMDAVAELMNESKCNNCQQSTEQIHNKYAKM